MPEVVETTDVDESADATEVAAPTQPVEDVATIKRRLAGKDQALTRAQLERDQERTRAEDLQRKVLEYEKANMSEVEKLQRERDDFAREAAAAKVEAQRERLARKFPLSFEALGEATPTDEAALTALEGRLAAKHDESEPEPRIDANNPKRPAIEVTSDAEWAAMDRLIRDSFGKGPATS